jgi:chromosome partitioning protein
MLHHLPSEVCKAPHVIVVGNEKGGCGKTTIAMHLAAALLKDGQRVGTIDLDGNQKSLTHYTENRRLWAKHRGIELEIPLHRCIQRARGASVAENEAAELAALEAAIASLARFVDFLVIDTPANDSYLMRLAHLAADTLLTPLNESFLDLASLASIDPVTHELTETGHYAALVSEARHHRRLFDRGHIDWFVIRNRFSGARLLDESLDDLAARLAFKPVDGCAERLEYRQLFPAGLTAFDMPDEAATEDRTRFGHLAAQREVSDLYARLQLPTDSRARRRAVARAEWFAHAGAPIELSDVLAV